MAVQKKKDRSEKRMVYMCVCVHWIKAEIMLGLYNKKIDLSKDTLRDIAKKIGLKEEAPQQIKHHLEGLVNMGTLSKVGGRYDFKIEKAPFIPCKPA